MGSEYLQSILINVTFMILLININLLIYVDVDIGQTHVDNVVTSVNVHPFTKMILGY